MGFLFILTAARWTNWRRISLIISRVGRRVGRPADGLPPVARVAGVGHLAGSGSQLGVAPAREPTRSRQVAAANRPADLLRAIAHEATQ